MTDGVHAQALGDLDKEWAILDVKHLLRVHLRDVKRDPENVGVWLAKVDVG